jgi:hypothetical protein
MSQLGHQRTRRPRNSTSALPPKADKSDIGPCPLTGLKRVSPRRSIRLASQSRRPTLRCSRGRRRDPKWLRKAQGFRKHRANNRRCAIWKTKNANIFSKCRRAFPPHFYALQRTPAPRSLETVSEARLGVARIASPRQSPPRCLSPGQSRHSAQGRDFRFCPRGHPNSPRWTITSAMVAPQKPGLWGGSLRQ